MLAYEETRVIEISEKIIHTCSLCEEGNGGIQEERRSVWYLRNWISDHGRGYVVLSNRTHVGYTAKSR